MKVSNRGIALEDSRHEEESQTPKAHQGQVHSATIQAGDLHAIGSHAGKISSAIWELSMED